MKKKPFLTALYFLTTIVVIYCAFVNTNQNTFSKAENRTLTTVDSVKTITINDYYSKSVQNNVESLIKDQFPLKEGINKSYIKTQKLLSDVISKICRNKKPFLIPVGTANRISGTNYYIGDVLNKANNFDTLINNRIYNFDKIYQKYGDKYKMYIYKPATAEEMSVFDNEYTTSNGEQYWQQFSSSLEGRYKVKRQEINTLDDYMKIHYATDHHWNYLGAYQGYTEIMNMISEDFNDVGKPYNMINVVKHKEPFYGSTSIHNGNCLGYDDFVTYDINYEKDYTIYIDGVKVDSLGMKDDVFNNPDEYMYEGYYGYNEKAIRIENNNCKNNRTLLVFGDSFSNSINEDLAAHFKTTYIIDTRFIYGDDPAITTFSLDDFLKEHNVDCILWLQFYTNLYFDSSCYLHIKINE